jgi:MFS family permease
MDRPFNQPLWHHREFLKLWGGQSISELGSGISQVALPSVAVLILHATPFQLGVIGALTFLPFLLLSLGAGVAVDRLPRRALMIAADSGRMLLLGSIPISFALGVLSLNQIYFVAFLTGACTVFFDVGYQAYLLGLVGRANLIEGNAKLQTSSSVVQIIGPGLAGFLVQIVGSARSVAVDALSYLASIISLALIREQQKLRVESSHERIWSQLTEGIRHVWHQPLLRIITVTGATHNFGAMMSNSLFFYFAYQILHLPPVLLGFAIAVGGLGAVMGSIGTGSVVRRLGVGRTLIVTQLLTGVAFLILPLSASAVPLLFVTVSQLLLGLQRPIHNITQLSLRQAITPDRLQGRMNASIRMVIWGIYPLGALFGGWMGTRVGVVATLVAGGAVCLAAAAWPALQPMRSLRELPGQSWAAAR